MNPEEKFQQALTRDIASASRHDPTAAWKADILAHATAGPARPAAKVVTFPRLILLAWAACWVLALVLHFMTPSDSASLFAHSKIGPAPSPADWHSIETRRATMRSLFAANDPPNLSRP